MLQYAFKEWAVICEALAQGRQALILRKGGIAETDDEFRMEHTRFWLYPTYTHQQTIGINEETRPLLAKAETERPPAGTLHLQWWAEVTGVYCMRELTPALMLGHLHSWSDEAVRQRFNYRTPGLNVLAVRVYRAAVAHEIAELPAYEGCRSWVTLERALPTEGSTAVLGDEDYRAVQRQLDLLLNPTAMA